MTSLHMSWTIPLRATALKRDLFTRKVALLGSRNEYYPFLLHIIGLTRYSRFPFSVWKCRIHVLVK